MGKGGLFREVSSFQVCPYRDGFNCIQKSTFLGSSVSDPLRPLWPALGIIASFIVTFLFISGGALVDRLRGKQGEDDDDGERVCV